MFVENRAQVAFNILYIGVILLSAIFDSYTLAALFLLPFVLKSLSHSLIVSLLWFLPLSLFPTQVTFTLASSFFLLSIAEQLYMTSAGIVPVTSAAAARADEMPALQKKLQKELQEKIQAQHELFAAEKKTLQKTHQEELLLQTQKQAEKLEAVQREKAEIESSLQSHLESIQKQLYASERALQEAQNIIQEKDQYNSELQEQISKHQDGSELKILRNHFEEKKHELIELRRALFLAQEEIELLERKLHDEKEHLDLKAFQTGRELFAGLTHEVESLQSERQLLEEIIAKLQGGAYAAHTT